MQNEKMEKKIGTSRSSKRKMYEETYAASTNMDIRDDSYPN